jgi:hypothetical protein
LSPAAKLAAMTNAAVVLGVKGIVLRILDLSPASAEGKVGEDSLA